MELQELLNNALLIVLTSAIPIFVRLVQQYFKRLEVRISSETDLQNYQQMRGLTELLVRAADQYRKSQGWNSEKAKEYVINQLLSTADEIGIDLAPAMADTLVEGVLNEIRQQTIIYDAQIEPA